jgi:hypothetical protein
MQVYAAGLEVGVYADKNEVRDAEGKAPIDTAAGTSTPPAAASHLRIVSGE